MPNLGEAYIRPYQDAAPIAADPEYGRIVCFCERVTAARSATRTAPPSRPPTSTGCGAAPAR